MSFFKQKQINQIESCLALALKRGASGAAIEANYEEAYACGFAAGRLKHTGTSESLRYKIEVIRNGKRGSASGNIFSELDKMLERALLLADNGAKANFQSYPEPGKYVRLKQNSSSVSQLTREKLVQDCTTLVSGLKELDAEMDIDAGAKRSQSQSVFAHSGGFLKKYNYSQWSLGAGFSKLSGEDMLFAGRGRSWGKVNSLYDLSYLGGKLTEDYHNGRRLVEFGGGTLPVVLSPSLTMQFLSPLIGALNGRNVYKGVSPLKERLGKKVFNAALQVRDEPHIDYAPGSSSFDSVGLPTRPALLIEDGVVRMFMYDYDTAQLAGQKPSGHRSCAPYNVRLRPGKIHSREMLANCTEAVYIQSLLGFGQSNLANGDFSCNLAVAYLVRNGEIQGRIKNAMIAGNIFELFAGDLQISADLEPNSQMPHLLFPNMNIASKSR